MANLYSFYVDFFAVRPHTVTNSSRHSPLPKENGSEGFLQEFHIMRLGTYIVRESHLISCVYCAI